METRSRAQAMMRDAQNYVSLQESAAMARAARDHGRVRDALLISVLATTGRRICEVVPQSKYELKGLRTPHEPFPGFRPRDLDLTLCIGYFVIAKKRNPKGFVRLPFPMKKSLMIALIEYARTRGIGSDQPFFKITTRQVENIIKKWASFQNIVRYPPARHAHGLRHGLGIAMSRAAKNPQDILSISQQLAHSDVSTTAVYMKFSTAHLRELMRDTIGE